MSVDWGSWWSQFVNWIRGNWLYLLVAAGGFAVGWVAKAYLDPPQVEYMVPEEYRELAEKTIQEWRQKGYPEPLIEKAIKWARDWSTRLANALVPEPSMAGEFAEMIYPKALQFAGKWLEAMAGTPSK